MVMTSGMMGPGVHITVKEIVKRKLRLPTLGFQP